MAKGSTTRPQTVKFNVGGKIFETARSLIDQHEDTVIARLVSDASREDPTGLVFIDRDGDMFAHVLNYLRCGSVSLPITISRDMFLRDLDFYGIVPGEGTVKACFEAWAVEEVGQSYKTKSLQVTGLDDELKNIIEVLASHCAAALACAAQVPSMCAICESPNEMIKTTQTTSHGKLPVI